MLAAAWPRRLFISLAILWFAHAFTFAFSRPNTSPMSRASPRQQRAYRLFAIADDALVDARGCFILRLELLGRRRRHLHDGATTASPI